MLSLLLRVDVPPDAGDSPPWWFLASVVVAILAIGVFTLVLATRRGKRRGRPCPSCGNAVQAAWVRCPVCGVELRGATAAPADAATVAPAVASVAPSATAPRSYSGPPQLEFKSGPLGGKTFVLDKDVTTVGSVDGNTIVLVDTGVSRKHVGIRKIDGGFELADLGSTNGVFVNGEKTARRRLVAGDLIRIGTSEATFLG